MKAIELNQLTKIYGKNKAIDEVSFSIDEGDIYGFIGPNGAGKSTTIKALLNFIYPTSGNATIFSMDTIKDSKKIKQQVGYVSSDVRLYPQMTGKEIITLAAKFHQIDNIEKKTSYYLDLFDIDPRKRIENMSLGNKKKISIVAALIVEPKLLILDEPTNGLDPLIQHRLFEELQQRNKEGLTVFLSSHDLHEVQEYCQKAAFIRKGKIVTIEDIAQASLGKVIELKGKDLPTASLQQAGARLIQEKEQEARFLFEGDLQVILPLLQQKGITDISIRNQELDDKFMSLYEGGDPE